MSKISGKNSVTHVMAEYWRRFAASGIVSAHRYRNDFFYRAEVNAISLLAFFSVLIIGAVLLSFYYLLGNAIEAIQSEMSNEGLSDAAFFVSLQDIKTRYATLLFFVTAPIILTFGYIMSRAALAATKNALSVQRRLMSNIAHELRTPLAVMKTNTEVALFSKSIDRTVRETFESNVEELDRVSDIIDNLLSLSRSLEPEGIQFYPVDLNKVVMDVKTKLSPLTESKGITVSSVHGEISHIEGNSVAIEQIVTNILKNAIDHSPDGGDIDIATRETRSHEIEVSIKDYGRGIAETDLRNIFEPFYRGEPSRSRQYGSSGLGLSIVSELVKLHRGKIIVQSAPGRGTTMVVLFPKSNIKTVDVRNKEIELDFSKGKSR